jgi:hypothetical protein
LAVDVLIGRSKDFIEVERVFDARSPSAGDTIRTVLRVCNQFRAIFEFAQRRNARLLGLKVQDDMVPERLFGALSAFMTRCQDLLEICVTNSQFMGSSGGDEASIDRRTRASAETGDDAGEGQHRKGGAARAAYEMASVAKRYRSLIGNIRAAGRRCLDIADEQLRNDFQVRLYT